MSYSRSFRYCTTCHRSTVHTRTEVTRDGKREERHQCTKCDAETTRLLEDRRLSRS
jgi:hypothetical protein